MEKYCSLVSVILPTYNRDKFILKSIESVLNQTYSNLELIIIDDCSNDETEKIVKEIQDKRIKYIKNNKNRGANYSRNKGIKMAQGDYIAFEDSDDIWHKDKLERQMQIIKKKDADFVYSYYNYIRNGIKRIYPVNIENYSAIEKNEKILDVLLKQNIITTATILVKKELLFSVGLFDENMPRMQEWELCIRLAQKCKFACIEEALADVYFTKGSITSKSKLLVEAKSIIVNKHHKIMYIHNSLSNFIYSFIDELVSYSQDDKELNQFLSIFNKNISKNLLNQFNLKIEDLNERAYTIFREKSYTNISMKWIKYYNSGKKIDNYLRHNNWHKIAIYGYGELGEMLYKSLDICPNIDIVVILDKNIINIGDKEIHIININEIKNYQNILSKIDCIIVTPVFVFTKIQEELIKYIDKPILPLNKLFE